MTADVIESLRQSVMNHYGFGTDEMKKTKVCVFCGAKLSADTKICTECGKEVSKKDSFRRLQRTSRLLQALRYRFGRKRPFLSSMRTQSG